VLKRVDQEIVERLCKPHRVGPYWERRWRLHHNAGGRRRERRAALTYQADQIDWLHGERKEAMLQACGVQELGDETLHPRVGRGRRLGVPHVTRAAFSLGTVSYDVDVRFERR
jgi:hypothetical protein